MSVPRAGDEVAVRFTNRGDAALNELATVLTARCSRTPESIARVLDEVMHTPLDDLAAALDAIVAAVHDREDTQERSWALARPKR